MSVLSKIGPSSFMKVALIAGIGSAMYLKFVRPHVLNFGATPDEAMRTMPGDSILSDVALQTTRATTIDAPPADIWPWLVQMGPRPRAGAYTYDWIERLLGIDIENTDRILPQFQQLEPNEFLGLNDKGQGLQVREVHAEQSLVLQWIPVTSTWAFGLYPDGSGKTRLISRNRLPGSGPMFWLGMVCFMEVGSLIMERKMLLGIRKRAEARARSRTQSDVGGIEERSMR